MKTIFHLTFKNDAKGIEAVSKLSKHILEQPGHFLTHTLENNLEYDYLIVNITALQLLGNKEERDKLFISIDGKCYLKPLLEATGIKLLVDTRQKRIMTMGSFSLQKAVVLVLSDSKPLHHASFSSEYGEEYEKYLTGLVLNSKLITQTWDEFFNELSRSVIDSFLEKILRLEERECKAYTSKPHEEREAYFINVLVPYALQTAVKNILTRYEIDFSKIDNIIERKHELFNLTSSLIYKS